MNNTFEFVRHFRKQNCFEGESLFYNKEEGKFTLINEGEVTELWRDDWSDHEIANTCPYKYETIEDLNRDLMDIYGEEISMEDLE